MNMASSTQFVPSRSMSIYDSVHQISMWEDALRSHMSPDNDVCIIPNADAMLNGEVMQSEYPTHESLVPPMDNHGAKSISEKVQRRLAQNREAARKSRMRKKAYVQQLEESRLKLAQLELEIERARQQGACIAAAGTSFLSNGFLDPGIVTFEMEYGQWIEEQQRKTSELRNVLQSPISDGELHVLVDDILKHYQDLFRLRAKAAKADVFYLVSGVRRTAVERFFLWIGGFRPSALVNVMMPHLQPLTDEQVVEVSSLGHACQQAEDALSQGIEKLRQTLAYNIAGDVTGLGNYGSHMASSIRQLEALETFVNQADHLRQQTLHHMRRILTARQAARGLIALAEYFERLRALSSLLASSPREMA